MGDLLLTTERLLLRRFTWDDVDHLVALDSDPAVMRFLNGGVPTPREVVERETMPRFLAYDERFPGFGCWAAIDRATAEFLGWFALRPEEDSRPGEVELGYRLRASAWGRGLATEGSRALIDRGFAEFGVVRVTANTMTVNAGSRRVMEKAGLRFVRTYFAQWPEVIEGSEFGDVEYALTRDEWEVASAARRGTS
ncbi:RimJ/RimL family protein N-acetyltransferase [Allocatelliglobosispora scoriae]|uniref:RimJ/RimL family protein N-acetyltransferase n=1 Tax=Allocatelliglobosispora scoriae TaxID=643052 RepID=A0A841BM93_9ACTN|nr:GNAT family N-acetyltransferase [Allocatelliglobosispora scoriae]MBB5868093.1 RimJ/RimL family protein N-acetyltransferase [Allocatelliglobosispora scoriae]